MIAQVTRFHVRKLLAPTRPDDQAGQAIARQVGAEWVGDSETMPAELLHEAKASCDPWPISRVATATSFWRLPPQVPVHAQIQIDSLRQANEALADLRAGCVTGAAVLVNDSIATSPD